MDSIIDTNTNSATVASTSVSRDFLHMLSVVNWSAPSQDLFVVLLFIVTVFLYGISLGRGRIVVVLVSIYMAFAVITTAPLSLIHGVNVEQLFVWKMLAFLVLFALLLLLVSRSALMRVVGNMMAASWWQVLLFSILHVGLLVSIVLSLLPPDFLRNLAPITKMIFATDLARFLWVVAPIAGLAILQAE